MALPCAIGNYTDFYAGIHHARHIGQLFRPDAPLLPNYQSVPIGYHGRASSIGLGGPVRRPHGQLKGTAEVPEFAPCRRLDLSTASRHGSIGRSPGAAGEPARASQRQTL